MSGQMVLCLDLQLVVVDRGIRLVSYQVAAEAAPLELIEAGSLFVHPKEHKHRLIC